MRERREEKGRDQEGRTGDEKTSFLFCLFFILSFSFIFFYFFLICLVFF